MSTIRTSVTGAQHPPRFDGVKHQAADLDVDGVSVDWFVTMLNMRVPEHIHGAGLEQRLSEPPFCADAIQPFQDEGLDAGENSTAQMRSGRTVHSCCCLQSLKNKRHPHCVLHACFTQCLQSTISTTSCDCLLLHDVCVLMCDVYVLIVLCATHAEFIPRLPQGDKSWAFWMNKFGSKERWSRLFEQERYVEMLPVMDGWRLW